MIALGRGRKKEGPQMNADERRSERRQIRQRLFKDTERGIPPG
jgi:hypothetical protein